MTTKTKARAKKLTPYQGDQLTFQFEYKVPKEEIFDFSNYESSDLIGSQSDQFYTPAEIKESHRGNTEVKARNEADMWLNNKGWHGYPLLPMEYPGQIFRGIRGGMARQQNSGFYIGPAFTDGKFRLKASPLTGPIEFPFVKKGAKITRDRVAVVNTYVKEWEQWWRECGRHDPECLKEVDVIADELERWKGVTLLHWCRPMDPADELQKRLKCPSTTIIEAVNDLCEDF